MAEYPELQVLFDSGLIAGLAAGATSSPAPARTETDEVWEAVYIEEFPPLTGLGAVEDLRYVYPWVDGESQRQYVQLDGRHDELMAVPPINTWPNLAGRKVLKLGEPIWSPLSRGNALFNTTLKIKETLSVYSIAGLIITGNFRFRVWGYKYRERDLVRFAGTPSLSVAPYTDRHSGRTLPIAKSVSLSKTDWDKLPGGRNQDKPVIMPFQRFSRNSAATTPNQEYYFNAGIAGTVPVPDENLWFALDTKEAYILKSIGVRTTSVNLQNIGLSIDGLLRPKGRLPAAILNNPYQFGMAQPMFAAAVGAIFMPLHDFDVPYLIWNENGGPYVLDNGAAVGALAIVIALGGIRVTLT